MDLLEALEAAGVPHRPGSAEDEIYLCCPFCMKQGTTPDTRFRLGVNTSTGQANCFNCDWKGRGEYTFRQLANALETGAFTVNLVADRKERKNVEVDWPEGFEKIRPDRRKEYWHNKAYKYLRNRGVTDEQIESKKIGFTVVGDMAFRIVIPIIYKGKLRGLVGRDFTEKSELPYKNSEAKVIYNISSRSDNKAVCLSEGAFDALKIERGAKKLSIDSGALLGKAIQYNCLDMLKNYKTLYIWLDPDREGIKGMIKIWDNTRRYDELKGKALRIIVPRIVAGKSGDKDPSELHHHDITKRLAHAPVFTEGVRNQLATWLAFEED